MGLSQSCNSSPALVGKCARFSEKARAWIMGYLALHCLFSFDQSWCDGIGCAASIFSDGVMPLLPSLQPVHDTLDVIPSRAFLCDLRVRSTRRHVDKIVASAWRYWHIATNPPLAPAVPTISPNLGLIPVT